MKIVYISGAFLGNGTKANAREVIKKNIETAKTYAKSLAKNNIGFFLPHIHSVDIEEKSIDQTQRFYYEQDVEFLTRSSDAVLFIPGWQESLGARCERKIAEELKLPMFFPKNPDDIKEIIDWNKTANIDPRDDDKTIDWHKIIDIRRGMARAMVPAAA